MTISSLIKDGRDSLEKENYWSSLSLALMLPSICSRVEFSSEAFCGSKKELDNPESKIYYRIKNDGTRHWSDKKAYIDWCNKYIFQKNSYLNCILGQDGASILYLLRCDLFHARVADLYYNKQNIYLSLGKGSGAAISTSRLIISISSLCSAMFTSVEGWVQDTSVDSQQSTYIFDLYNSDDNLLFHTLCKEDRANELRRQFSDYEIHRAQKNMENESEKLENEH
ncbi:hypothetical protein [Pseudoflavonifractor phocaeensis]|uniref:hypothetical protein n=1 Tax=Pseudoflavonifractor phocaeensis TaxID=1870988 RepID=UPI00195A2EA9|nr:hypothetical protein [Pseudoflavonifractor phocaeensis]MBM6722771.1 hypothetical protein [Pseudoflavonifractor phocaeensis]